MLLDVFMSSGDGVGGGWVGGGIITVNYLQIIFTVQFPITRFKKALP
jgi:hypothetical protein